MRQKINKEKERGARLKQKVQILGSLNTADKVWIQNGDYVLMEVPVCSRRRNEDPRELYKHRNIGTVKNKTCFIHRIVCLKL